MSLSEGLQLATAAATVLAVFDFLIRMWLHRHRDKSIRELSEKVTSLEIEAAHLRHRSEGLTDERDAARRELADTHATIATSGERITSQEGRIGTLTSLVAELEETRGMLVQKQNVSAGRVRRALESEGEIWTQPVMAGTPKFRPLSERKTPIVSVLNLKGGVGKTTVTAYLGWALARRGHRVLLVDLDLQGSLSSLFVPAEQLGQESQKGERLLQHFLKKVARDPKAKLLDHTLPVPQLNDRSRLVAATDKLAYAELSQAFQWLLRVGGRAKHWNGRHDGRMILRRALHSPALHRKFDVILMDCPPLINLCCANALAASDYVLTPLPPSEKAIERVTPLLTRVLEIRAEVNPALNMLGLVLNNTAEKALTPREHNLLINLSQNCLDVFKSPVERFDTTIPQRVSIRASEGGFWEPDDAMASVFEQLAEEFTKRLPAACLQPQAARKRAAKPLGGLFGGLS